MVLNTQQLELTIRGGFARARLACPNPATTTTEVAKSPVFAGGSLRTCLKAFYTNPILNLLTAKFSSFSFFFFFSLHMELGVGGLRLVTRILSSLSMGISCENFVLVYTEI